MPMRGMLGGAAMIAMGLAAQPAAAESVKIDAAQLPSLGKIDHRFQSYNVEMAEIIGGKFWKPYADIKAPPEQAPGTDPTVGRDPNLYQARPPIDLSNHRLRALAAALGPAYIRVSGSWSNGIYFQDDDAPALATPPDGFAGVLTRAEWRGVVDFAKAVNAELVTSFTISKGVRDAAGVWTPVEAAPFVKFTHAAGGKIAAAELFNEPNYSGNANGPKDYSPSAYARDMVVFRKFIAQAEPTMKIVGPGDTIVANYRDKDAPTPEDWVTAKPRGRFDAYSYHFYNAVSERCVKPGEKGGASESEALSEEWFARTGEAFKTYKDVRDRDLDHTPIWLTETAQAACGGSRWAATYRDSFRYLDQMGSLAKGGLSAIFHNTLAASEYGLIDEKTLDPRPNYWAALLWRRLMGVTVLDAGTIRPGFHVYAHCAAGHKGGVTVLAINSGETDSTVDVASPADVYTLTAPSLDSRSALLNGHALTVGQDDRVPSFTPVVAKGPQVSVASHTIAFIVLPKAANPQCE